MSYMCNVCLPLGIFVLCWIDKGFCDMYQGNLVFLCWTSSGHIARYCSSFVFSYKSVFVEALPYSIKTPTIFGMIFLNFFKTDRKRLPGAAVIGITLGIWILFFSNLFCNLYPWIFVFCFLWLVSCKDTTEIVFGCVVNVYCGSVTIL